MLNTLPNYKDISKDIRSLLGCSGSYYPILDVLGFEPPKVVGRAGYYTTKSGKTEIRYPNSYKWHKVYHRSTKAIVVGRGWLIQGGFV